MSRRFILFIVLSIVAVMCRAQAQAAIVPLADPYILVGDSLYYAYGTHAADGIEYWTSTDLLHWRYGGLALEKSNTTESRWFWAPEVYKIDGRYVMYYSADEHLFAAVADSPTGPFKQVGGYMLETLLGDEKCIDSSRFRDDDGSQYLFFVRFTDGNCIWMCRLEADGITPVAGTLRHCLSVSEPWESKLGRVCEGPFVVKHEGLYYLTYSANDFRSQDYGVGVAVSSSLQGPWTKSATSPILCRADSLLGTGHHSLFTDRAGRPHIVFHAHDSQSSVQPRRMHIGSVEFQGQEIVVRGRSHPAWVKGPAQGSGE